MTYIVARSHSHVVLVLGVDGHTAHLVYPEMVGLDNNIQREKISPD